MVNILSLGKETAQGFSWVRQSEKAAQTVVNELMGHFLPPSSSWCVTGRCDCTWSYSPNAFKCRLENRDLENNSGQPAALGSRYSL